ncbi:MAG: hypothetical protein LJE75_12460 [Gammaproteobacteria bacterium]|nr:hypothetical protein [Gammaproteobacteria bacterium]
MMRIRAPQCIAMALTIISYGAFAGGIDLDCETLSEQMVDRLDAEGLLLATESGRQRALAITLDLCGGAEESAEQQSEVEKQRALDNWFFENHPEKAGNKRLKNLKR